MILLIPERLRTPVDSYAHASALYDATREASGERGSTFPSGVILDDAEEAIARVSYNGRVWAPGEWNAGDVPLFDNRPAATA